MLDKKIVNAAYYTKGNELCKYVRAEVMEQLECKDLIGTFTEQQYNEVVKTIMQKIKAMTIPLIEIEIRNYE